MIDKRSILKGAVGAAVLASGKNGPSATVPQMPGFPPTGGGRSYIDQSQPSSVDPRLAIRRHMMQRADEERERLLRDIDNTTQRLFELRSLSPAYRRYRIAKLEQERRAIHKRWHQLAESI